MSWTPETARQARARQAPRTVPNRATAQLRELVLGALDDAGGRAYLLERARDPDTMRAFLALIGKCLPREITGPEGGPISLVMRDAMRVDLAEARSVVAALSGDTHTG